MPGPDRRAGALGAFSCRAWGNPGARNGDPAGGASGSERRATGGGDPRRGATGRRGSAPAGATRRPNPAGNRGVGRGGGPGRAAHRGRNRAGARSRGGDSVQARAAAIVLEVGRTGCAHRCRRRRRVGDAALRSDGRRGVAQSARVRRRAASPCADERPRRERRRRA